MATRDYRLMALFVAIADSNSIRAASRRLNVSAPVVSTALADLEATLGTTLVRRGRRQLELTPDGRAFHAAAREMVRAADTAMSLFRADLARPRGRLAVTLPTELCVAWLPPLLHTFEAKYPDVRTEIDATDAVIELPRSSYDIAVRARFALRASDDPAGFTAMPLALVGAPSFAARFAPRKLAKAGPLPLIGFSERANNASVAALRPDGTAIVIPATMRIRINSGLLAEDLARTGLGAALVIEAAVEADIAAGRLVRLLPTYRFGVVVLRLLMRDTHPSPAARVFAEFIQAPAGRLHG